MQIQQLKHMTFLWRMIQLG